MKKYLIYITLICSIVLLIPLTWTLEKNIQIEWVKFTEEYYKVSFSIIQLLIGFSFFTLLYNKVEYERRRKSLNKIKGNLIEIFQEMKNSGSCNSTDLIKIINKTKVYTSLYTNYIPDQEELILFNENVIEIRNIASRALNSIDNEDILKVELVKLVHKTNEYTDAKKI